MSSVRSPIGVREDVSGRFAAIFADAADPMSHHRAVVDALRASPMMPLAYGAAQLSDLRRLLAERQDELAVEFRRCRDLVEMGLHVAIEAAPVADAEPARNGRDFLRRAQNRTASVEAYRARAKAVVTAASTCPGVVRWRVLSSDQSNLSAALAVRRAAGAAVAETLCAMFGDGVTVETSGPWPLYSFGLSDMLDRERAA